MHRLVNSTRMNARTHVHTHTNKRTHNTQLTQQYMHHTTPHHTTPHHTTHTYTTLHTHTHTHTHTQTQTNKHTNTTHTKQKKAKSLAATKRSCRPSEPALGCLGTTQALQAGASKSTSEGASTLQVTLCHAPGWRFGHPRSHLDLTH